MKYSRSSSKNFLGRPLYKLRKSLNQCNVWGENCQRKRSFNLLHPRVRARLLNCTVSANICDTFLQAKYDLQELLNSLAWKRPNFNSVLLTYLLNARRNLFVLNKFIFLTWLRRVAGIEEKYYSNQTQQPWVICSFPTPDHLISLRSQSTTSWKSFSDLSILSEEKNGGNKIPQSWKLHALQTRLCDIFQLWLIAIRSSALLNWALGKLHHLLNRMHSICLQTPTECR